MSDLSAADIVAMKDNSDGLFGGGAGGNWFIVLILFLLMLNGGWGNNGNNAATQGALTRAELYDGLNGTEVKSSLQNIADGVNGINVNMLNGFNQNQMGMMNGFAGVNANITAVGNQMQQCCCTLQNAVHSEGEATRALITENTIQALRDKNAEVTNTLQSAQLTLAQANQTQNIISTLEAFILANKSTSSTTSTT